MLDRMEATGHKNVVLVSPEPGTYGDIFSTALEREIRLRGDQLFCLNYQVPFRRKKTQSASWSSTKAVREQLTVKGASRRLWFKV